jgi:hypothetical protein
MRYSLSDDFIILSSAFWTSRLSGAMTILQITRNKSQIVHQLEIHTFLYIYTNHYYI